MITGKARSRPHTQEGGSTHHTHDHAYDHERVIPLAATEKENRNHKMPFSITTCGDIRGVA